jgi:hypothetical protein
MKEVILGQFTLLPCRGTGSLTGSKKRFNTQNCVEMWRFRVGQRAWEVVPLMDFIGTLHVNPGFALILTGFNPVESGRSWK